MKSSLTRRQVLKLGAAAVAAPMIVPFSVFGQNALTPFPRITPRNYERLKRAYEADRSLTHTYNE